MAAYSAVISLLQTLVDQQNISELFHDHTAQTLDSLHATAEYFQHVLENITRFDSEKIRSLEEKIRVVVSYAEDVVAMKISLIIKGSSWTFGILQHQDLLPLVEKMDTIKKQVMDIVSHDDDQLLKLSAGDSLIDASSTTYQKLEDDIVNGLDDDLEIIVKRLTGPPRDLDVVTITGMGGIGKTTLARKAYDHLTIRLTKLEAFKFSGSPSLHDTIKRFGFPTSVRRLSLTWCCGFYWADISSTFTVLPNLEELKLKRCFPLSHEWSLTDKDKFKSLKLLLLTDLYLDRWEASSDNFPNLKRLVLNKCDLEIPTDFGEICTLESIEVHDCDPRAEDSAINIEQEQEEMGNNILKVYIHSSRRK